MMKKTMCRVNNLEGSLKKIKNLCWIIVAMVTFFVSYYF